LRRELHYTEEKFYIDSNIFIYPIIYDHEFIEEAKRSENFLLEIALGGIEAYTSSITWDEVTWVVRKILGLNLSLDQGRKFLSFPNLKLIAIRRTTILKAQEIMEKYKIKPRDSIHVAAALENNIKTLVSYDEDFDQVREIKRVEP
jgi:predicted nucleic acid-binding protein